MIKNIVFDNGGVLVKFNPNDYLDYFNYGKEKSKVLYDIIFNNIYYAEYSKGKLSPNEFREIIINSAPQFEKEILEIMAQDNLIKLLPFNTEMVELLKKLKNDGFKIYILSNIYYETAIFLRSYDFYHLIDGEIFSNEVGVSKPDKQIYELLLKKYMLIAEETLFIDDSKDNIEMAKQLGIKTVLCIDVNKAIKEIEYLTEK